MKPDLEAIRARAEKATAGPWFKGYVGTDDGNTWVITNEEDDGYVVAEAVPFAPPNEDTWKHNASFIAHSRTDIPALLAYINSLERAAEKVIVGAENQGAHSGMSLAQAADILLAAIAAMENK